MTNMQAEKIAINSWATGINRMAREAFRSLWLESAREAIRDAELPAERKSWIFWAIGLAANSLAFAACFYPPTAVLGAIASSGIMYQLADVKAPHNEHFWLLKNREAALTRANGIMGILGNGLNLANQIAQYPGGVSTNPKAWLSDVVANKADALANLFVTNSRVWVTDVMVPASRFVRIVKNLGPARMLLPNWASHDWYDHTPEAETARHQFIFENYFFPDGSVPASNIGGALLRQNKVAMQAALVDFKRQYEKWLGETIRASSGSGVFGALSLPGLPNFEEHAKKHPFEPVFTFPSLPSAAQVKLNSSRQKVWPLVQGVR